MAAVIFHACGLRSGTHVSISVLGIELRVRAEECIRAWVGVFAGTTS